MLKKVEFKGFFQPPQGIKSKESACPFYQRRPSGLWKALDLLKIFV